MSGLLISLKSEKSLMWKYVLGIVSFFSLVFPTLQGFIKNKTEVIFGLGSSANLFLFEVGTTLIFLVFCSLFGYLIWWFVYKKNASFVKSNLLNHVEVFKESLIALNSDIDIEINHFEKGNKGDDKEKWKYLKIVAKTIGICNNLIDNSNREFCKKLNGHEKLILLREYRDIVKNVYGKYCEYINKFESDKTNLYKAATAGVIIVFMVDRFLEEVNGII